MQERLLDVKNLKTWFYTESGVVHALEGVNFHVKPGETLGIVGESGCGKSVSSLSILQLIPQPPGKIVDGEIHFDGRDLLTLTEREIRRIRGNDISMIFQEPMTSLNPVFTIGYQLGEVLRQHRKLDNKQIRAEVIRMLDHVGIPGAAQVVDDYPFALSGGMRQRAMIAMALACRPKLLIADEPTTALDVTIQAQILELMREMQRETGTAILFITHDLGVIAEMADRVVVMYAGHVVEESDVHTLFHKPRHPYTQGLLNAKPDLNTDEDRLSVIPGTVPNLLNRPDGCQFHPRCPRVMDRCRTEQPPCVARHGTRVSCWLYSGEEDETWADR